MKSLPSKIPDVIYQQVTDGAVLLSTQDEVYFGLDGIGALIWELLTPDVGTIDRLCDELGRRFPDVEAETLRADALEFLNALLEAGLVRFTEPGQLDGA